MRCPANICPMILLCVVQSLYCRAEARRLLQERQGTTNMGGAQSESSMLRFSIVGRMERGQRAARRKGEENVEQCWPRLTCHVATLSGKYVSLWRSNQQYQGLGSSSQGASPFVMRDRCQRELKVCNQLLRLILNFCELYKLSHQGMGRLAFQGSSSTFYTSQNN